MPASPTSLIADYAASTTITGLPADVIERTKQVIFDEMACSAFGQRSAAGTLATKYARSMGGAAEAQILGTSSRVTAPYAALANGTAGHGEEVDGAHVVGGHPGASIVHAAVAMAERQCATGADLINAVALGYDIGTRIVAACGGKFVVRDTHRLNSDLFYALGATAAAGRLLGLNAERHVHAQALATFQTNGLYALYSEKRHISKSFCNGQYAFAGVSAALMSAAGLEGNEDIIGHDYGLLATWGEAGSESLVTADLGTRFAIEQANFKFLNAGYPIHAPVEAAMTAVAENGIDLSQIAQITVGMPSRAMRVVNGRDMHNICVQDILSASLVLGGLKLTQSPFPAVLANPAFQALRGKISMAVDPEIEQDNPNGRGARVTITLKDGSSHSQRVDHPKGHSARGGVTWSDLAGKWAGNLPDCDVEAALGVARRLEEVEDVRTLASAFAGPF
ncbi:MmgE/PrpD family protein [Sphingobium sp.]|uniref:MmgE/PrpD family protein n=1 Tax=Sphingobium sp. TaxID=1912891 RepID=UPI002613A86D|nr:MmgE/PrpD family protein [Sphingobium sp.]